MSGVNAQPVPWSFVRMLGLSGPGADIEVPRSNIRPSASRTLALVDGDDPNLICVVERTFFNSTSHQRLDPDTVTQSTC